MSDAHCLQLANLLGNVEDNVYRYRLLSCGRWQLATPLITDVQHGMLCLPMQWASCLRKANFAACPILPARAPSVAQARQTLCSLWRLLGQLSVYKGWQGIRCSSCTWHVSPACLRYGPCVFCRYVCYYGQWVVIHVLLSAPKMYAVRSCARLLHGTLQLRALN